MADKVIIEAEVKSNVGEVGQDAASAAGEFQVMGVSLNGLKRGFVAMGRAAVASFASIKAGMMSTGVGALVVAMGSLLSFFTNTKRGADKLAEALAGIGAVVSVLMDRFSSLGEGLSLIFSRKWREGAKLLREAFSGIKDEVVEETKAMMALKKRQQELRDEEMKFVIQKAKTRKAIEKARLDAEDETKDAKVRLQALKDALSLEEQTTRQELRLATERMKIQKQEMALSENMVEDEEKLAQLKADMIDIETTQAKLKRRVIMEVNTLEREILAEEKARSKEKQDLINAEITLRHKLTLAVGASFGQMSLLMGEGTAAAKAFALAEVGTQTAVAFMQGLNIAQKAALGAGPGAALAFPIFYATQVAAILGTVNKVKGILGGVGGGIDTGSTSVASEGPSRQMMSGAFQLSGGVAPEPLRAYVVTDEMTSSQNQLANIRRRATI
tara:strand:+ start:71 stop:1399 length:1329 start_codon:yes stop_codon:yes gene_type:complete